MLTICSVFIFKLPLIKRLLHVLQHNTQSSICGLLSNGCCWHFFLLVCLLQKLLRTATSSNEKSMFDKQNEKLVCILGVNFVLSEWRTENKKKAVRIYIIWHVMVWDWKVPNRKKNPLQGNSIRKICVF